VQAIRKTCLRFVAASLLAITAGCQTNGTNDASKPNPSGAKELLADEGEVQLYVVVKVDGSIKRACIHKSSGSRTMDDFALRWVREHWKWPPADKTRRYLVPFEFHARDKMQPATGPASAP